MLKRIVAFCLILCNLMMGAVFAEGEAALSVSAPSAILMDAGSGRILFEKNSHEKRPPASVTKVMTMLLVMEAIDRGQITMEDMVSCSDFAASMGGSQVYLEPGEQMSVHDLLKAVAVASGNDAAVMLAEHAAGSHEAFVKLMNDRAKELKMADTHFVNCNGLDDDTHLTSAHDIALMSRALCSHPKIFEFTGIWMDSLRGGAFGLVNTNKLIRFYEGATGLKTGSTSKAGFCLSATAQREGLHLIAVVMGGETSKERFNDASRLLDFGFANYAVCGELLTEAELRPLRVLKGSATEMPTKSGGKASVLVEKARRGDIETRITLPEHVGAPICAGDVLGKAEFLLDGKLLGTEEIVAAANCERLGPVHMFGRLARQLLLGHF